MEILVNFEGSRRVVSVEDSSDLLVAVERELARRCPGRDIAIAPVDTKLSQSGSKEVYILQKCTEKWGYVDVTDSSQVKGGDEITLVKMPKLEENSGLSHKVSGLANLEVVALCYFLTFRASLLTFTSTR